MDFSIKFQHDRVAGSIVHLQSVLSSVYISIVIKSRHSHWTWQLGLPAMQHCLSFAGARLPRMIHASCGEQEDSD